MSAFNFNARYALLTYAQCGALDPWEVNNHLAELGAECIIAREEHADGGTHLHAFVDFGRKFRTRRSDVFDVGGCHPNISPSYGTPEKGFDYAIKDGDIVAGGLERPNGKAVSSSRDPWSTIIMAESRDEFFQLCADLAPRSLCTAFNSLSKYADWKYRVDPEPYRHDPSYQFDLGGFPELLQWSHDTFNAVGEVSKYIVLPVAYAVRLAKARFGGILPGGAPPTPQPARSRALGKEL